MIPNYLNSASPSPFPVQDSDQLDHPQIFFSNYQTASSSSVSYPVFFSPTQDQTEYYQTDMHQQQHQAEFQAENHAPYSGSRDPQKKPDKGLKIALWKNDINGNQADHQVINPLNKWMSSKVKLVQKMKKPDLMEITSSSSSSTAMKFEDQKKSISATLEADHFSSNNSSNNFNTPIRVCADCNTTKTPLWRSGPKGPKSLCNACGIRQRKARRAMAAAAAAAAANGTTPAYETTAPLKIKVQNKEKLKNDGRFKKKCKLNTTAESSQNPHAVQKKNGFEDFLFNLSKNLAFHRVFPQDEKEAAILLMALSCGLVHG